VATGWLRNRRRRARRQALAEGRQERLRTQGIDARLVDAVWGERHGVLASVLPAEIVDIEWLDEIAIDQPEVVPVFSIRPEQSGVVAVNGWLLHLDGERPPIQRDLFWAWCALLEDPLRALLSLERDGAVEQLPTGLQLRGRLDDTLLSLELERLRGAPLARWFEELCTQARGDSR